MAYNCILPCDKSTRATVILFKNVTNVAQLREDIKKGVIQASLLGTDLILNKLQVLSAINKAVNNQNKGNMATRSIYTEIIYNMSCTKSISAALTAFGIADADTNILAVILNDQDECEAERMAKRIHGDIAPLGELEDDVKTDAIKKIYKLTNEELQNGSLLNLVLGRIAAKEFISL